MAGLDVIGDVHGHASALVGLLNALGYRQRHGAWTHPDRQAVFVGDLIDRGPEQLATIAIVRAMVDAGSAQVVLGNHEFNAVAWATPDPDAPGEHLRRRTGEKGRDHLNQHGGFLAEVGDGTALHRELIGWFMTIPLWLDFGELRVVHACWDQPSMDVLAPLRSPSGSLTHELVLQGARPGNIAYNAIETLLKGPELQLPDGCSFPDGAKIRRTKARHRWWDPTATTLRDAAEIPHGAQVTRQGTPVELPDTPLDDTAHPQYTDPVPVIFGHYWRTPETMLVSPTTACVDYSAGTGGPLVAYQWNGGPRLSTSNLVGFPPFGTAT